MAQDETVVSDKDELARAHKKLDFLKQEVKELKKGQAEIKKSLTQLKKAKGLEQPTQKIKAVKKTVDDQTGRLKWVAGSEEYEQVLKILQKRGGLETSDLDKILKNLDVDKSTRQLHNDMNRLAEKFDKIEMQRASEREDARSNRLIYKG